MTRLDGNDARHATAHGGNERRGRYRLPSKEARRGRPPSRLGIASLVVSNFLSTLRWSVVAARPLQLSQDYPQ